MEQRSVYYASRSLTDAEKNYGQMEEEGLALIDAVRKFHRYSPIYGLQSPRHYGGYQAYPHRAPMNPPFHGPPPVVVRGPPDFENGKARIDSCSYPHVSNNT
ncbi:hypothetical protein TELCIR_06259 [Teladorsagia circumcincta]|uniref:Reverse transcriptase RNase H-like domain-containing protein n=1 Tax=Teladorsagia circumcincta TaxID=45464 RepID=A0A2G9UNV5_TELCI|nr:hypothetical protein TELCIR_06259 [Teladorsagia circumcincta]